MLFGAQAMGTADKLKGFAEQCMAEYDLDGWKVPDLTNPDELSYHATRGSRRASDARQWRRQQPLRQAPRSRPATIRAASAIRSRRSRARE